jgi:hypothetical protein
LNQTGVAPKTGWRHRRLEPWGCESWDALLHPSIHFSPLGGDDPFPLTLTPLACACACTRAGSDAAPNSTLFCADKRRRGPRSTPRLTPPRAAHQQWYAGISAANHSSGEQACIFSLASRNSHSIHYTCGLLKAHLTITFTRALDCSIGPNSGWRPGPAPRSVFGPHGLHSAAQTQPSKTQVPETSPDGRAVDLPPTTMQT